jgi:hypothetical protein
MRIHDGKAGRHNKKDNLRKRISEKWHAITLIIIIHCRKITTTTAEIIIAVIVAAEQDCSSREYDKRRC